MTLFRFLLIPALFLTLVAVPAPAQQTPTFQIQPAYPVMPPSGNPAVDSLFQPGGSLNPYSVTDGAGHELGRVVTEPPAYLSPNLFGAPLGSAPQQGSGAFGELR